MDQHEAEEYASVPWDYLVSEQRPDVKRWVMIGSAAVVVFALGLSATRTLWPAEPVPVSVPVALPAAVESSTTSTTLRALLTEAELFGIDLDAARATAVGHAQWFAHRYLTTEGEGPRSFVESIIPLETVQVGSSRFAVSMVIRSLVAGDGEAYVRSPDLNLEVVVDVTETGARVVDWPAPPVEAVTPEVLAPAGFTPSAPPPELLALAAARAGGEFVEAFTDGAVWRMLFDRADSAGIIRRVAVWLSGDGYPVPAGGFQR